MPFMSPLLIRMLKTQAPLTYLIADAYPASYHKLTGIENTTGVKQIQSILFHVQNPTLLNQLQSSH